MNDTIWLVNTGNSDYDRIDTSLGRHLIFKPNRPVQLPRAIAMKYLDVRDLKAITDPDKYFGEEPLSRLIIRDAGIGDLLLLEPVIRTLKEKGDTISLVTRYPEVFENSPSVSEYFQMNKFAEIPKGLKVSDWDTYNDLKSYSETCENRDTEHRTDCFNQLFDLNIEDKEPRLYFSDKDKSVLKKEEGFKYIGVALDGSHYFRRYAYGSQLIEHIINQDEKNIVVIIGDGWEDGKGYVKYDKKHKRVINLQAKTDIRQAINVIKDLDYMIAVDTGLMHCALALHIPTVCIFSIITPMLRTKYYTGQKVNFVKKGIDCIGCGNFHMSKCPHGDLLYDPSFIPPCLHIDPADIYDAMKSMVIGEPARMFDGVDGMKKVEVSNVVINIKTKNKLTMPIIVLNEEKNLPRFIELVIKNRNIGRVIAIDGGSDDDTVRILKSAGAEVYVHPYNKDYHDMQALQRNISCSYVRDDTKILIMDIDECFSNELECYLPELIEGNVDYGLLSRRTFDYYDDITDPLKQIKDYPDWQPRFFTWNKKFKWVGSPHHEVYNVPPPIKIKRDIVHFEKEGKDRVALESKWSEMQKKTKEVYG